DRLRQAIARARRSLALARDAGMRGVPAYYPAGSPSPAVSRLGVHKGKRVLLLSLKDVSDVRIEDKLVFVHSGPDRYLINRTIAELAELRGNDGFFQINRGTLINLNYLVEIVPWFSGTYRLKMADGAELPLSRDRVAQLKARIGLPKKWSGK